jgi:DNA polymerase-1
MASSDPNLQNLSSPWHGEATNPVQVVKELYDSKLREMFIVPEGAYLVGTDAESIQLRILAHYLKNDDYVHAIVSGLKEEGNDIHNVNRRALGLDYLTRDHAKTFIYAWLLGAGVAKVARILGCSLSDAKRAVEAFINNTEGLGELRSGLIQRDASRGYFTGLDGRRVMQPDAYYMLAGYLQNGETLVMKHANWMWHEQATAEKISFKQVNFVHDEWQVEVTDSYDAACRLGELQCKALEQVGKDLNVYCPLSGETKIGTNWLETH